ncbi:expressed unknown protein [Ectocarpus siliculosus]|uniref:C2 domain-containing protein n=1 Tax=Ectocarpus siliculosus TaxID=2880 RepID=D7G3K7_ECTSI|nr:expressed unknown protein [Ectocarpus siliculosus]|eukprot:CBJ27005.1 expressed unknown protein [Ectocarpus siliculosus]
MDLAHTSRYWKSYRESKTFTLTIYIYEAHLGVNSSISNNSSTGGPSGSGSGSTGGGGPWDTKIVVSLPKDPMGERHETGRAGKTSNPVWDQAVVLRDIEYSELVRVEMRRPRKIGENPVLASVEFEVHDVIGLSLREGASVFQLECDRSRARYGIILLAFRFDPPVAADVLGALDGVGLASLPRGVTTPADQGHDEGEKAPAWGAPEAGQQAEREVEVAEPVYINVEGHFACLLLDDDTPLNRCKSPGTKDHPDAAIEFDLAHGCAGQPLLRSRAGTLSSLIHPRLSTVSQNSVKSENSVYDYQGLIHGRGSAVRMAMNNNSNASGVGGKPSRPRPVSLGGSLGLPLSALGLGVGGGGGGGGGGGSRAGGKSGRPQSIDLRIASSAGNDAMGLESAHLETPQQRWVMPRRRHRHSHDASGGGNPDVGSSAVVAADGVGMRGSKAGGKRARSRAILKTPGFLKSPTLGGLRAGVGKAARATKSTSFAVPVSNAGGAGAGTRTPADSVDSSCASTVRAAEEASAADTPLFVPPALASSAVLCGLPASLVLSPTALVVASGLPSEE